MTDAWKYLLKQPSKAILLEMGEEAYTKKAVFKGNQYTAPLSIVDNGPKHNTREVIAEELGWSTGKVAKPRSGKGRRPINSKSPLARSRAKTRLLLKV